MQIRDKKNWISFFIPSRSIRRHLSDPRPGAVLGNSTQSGAFMNIHKPNGSIPANRKWGHKASLPRFDGYGCIFFYFSRPFLSSLNILVFYEYLRIHSRIVHFPLLHLLNLSLIIIIIYPLKHFIYYLCVFSHIIILMNTDTVCRW